MACYKPLTAWHSRDINPSGKRSLVFSEANAEQPDDPIQIACGQCVGCRITRSKQWAVRCLHESTLYENNSFITLTFDDKSLFDRENPDSLDVTEFQRFMKRLRKRFKGQQMVLNDEGKKTYPIRFFHCGEYGDENKRPHYHACLFNFDFPDKKLWSVRDGNRLYISDALSELWPYGFCTIGEVTFESAAYVARYIMKKVNGEMAETHYQRVNEETGEITEIKPEYTTMSRRPGIGKQWFNKYHSDVYSNDYVIINGKKFVPPKFYDGLLETIDPFTHDEVKQFRKDNAEKYYANNTDERLAVREEIQKKKLDRLPRNLKEN